MRALIVALLLLGTGNPPSPNPVRPSPNSAAPKPYQAPGVGGVSRPRDAKLGDIVSVMDFGAKGDGATDDTAAFNAALLLGKTVIAPAPAVSYKFASTINIPVNNTVLHFMGGNYISTASPAIKITGSGVTVEGEDNAAQFIIQTSAGDGIVTQAGVNTTTIRNLTLLFGSGGVRTAGTAIHLVGGSIAFLQHLFLGDPWDGINIDAMGDVFVSDIIITTGLAAQSLHDGVILSNGAIGANFQRMLITSPNTVDAGVHIGKETDTATFEYLIVQIPLGAFGFTFLQEGGSHKPQWVSITNAYVEVNKTTGIGFNIDSVRALNITDAYSAWGKNNIAFSANAEEVRVHGGEFILASQYGIIFNGGNDIEVSGAVVSDSSQLSNLGYDGITIAGGSGINLHDNYSGNIIFNGAAPASATNFMAQGISVQAGAFDNYSIAHNDLRFNNQPGLLDQGTGPNKQVFGNRMTGRVGTVVGNVLVMNQVALTYSVSIAVDASQGNQYLITATNGNAFTISNPTNVQNGMRLTLQIVNTSGGALGAITWGGQYKMAAWTSPATGFSRSIDFMWTGSFWKEVSRTPADVPN